MEYSANEIEALVLKAARGGGCPVGLAEDLAAAAAFVDLDGLTICPCDSGAVHAIPSAIDAVLAHGGSQVVRAEMALVQAYVAALQDQAGTISCTAVPGGVQLQSGGDDTQPAPLGRRSLRPDLAAHLSEMASKLLVPETDASRAGGAGAGLTDND